MLDEVVGGDEGQDMGLETFQFFVVADPDDGVLDRAVPALCLGIGPWMVRLDEPVLDAATAEDWDGVPQAAQHVVQWQHSLLPEGRHDGLLGLRQHRARRRLRPHGA